MNIGNGWINVCNEALAYLGKDPIQSIDEDSPAAMRCRAMLPATAESVLSERPWNSATREAVLAPLSREQDEGDGDCMYRFAIPPDLVRLVEVHAPVWRHIGDSLLSPRAPLSILYVSMPEEPASLSRMILEAMAYLLASRLAMPLAADSSSMANCYAMYQEALRKASIQEAAGERDRKPFTPSLYDDYRKLASAGSPFSMDIIRNAMHPGGEDADGTV